jgi:hypothetical protein
MKKYFAKYLPGEEEIKEGDSFSDKNGRIHLYKTGEFAGHKHTYWVNKYDVPYVKSECLGPLQLFLCYREIETVEEVTYRNDGKVAGTATAVDINTKTLYLNGFPVTLGNYYPKNPKVIGKISPDATWIKEAQEFDRLEWEYLSALEDRAGDEDDVICIQCPTCKTFH